MQQIMIQAAWHAGTNLMSLSWSVKLYTQFNNVKKHCIELAFAEGTWTQLYLCRVHNGEKVFL